MLPPLTVQWTGGKIPFDTTIMLLNEQGHAHFETV